MNASVPYTAVLPWHRSLIKIRLDRSGDVHRLGHCWHVARALEHNQFATRDQRLRFVRLNKRLAEINGIDPELHIGKRPDEVLPGLEDVIGLMERWRSVLSSGEPLLAFEVDGFTPAESGRRRSWSTYYYPIRVHDETVALGGIIEETTERKEAEENKKILMLELQHRTKNIMNLVLAIARSTFRASQPESLSVFSQRLISLSRSLDLLAESEFFSVDLRRLAEMQLSLFQDFLGKRITIDGAPVFLDASVAKSIGLAFHELATNAIKYGALSNESGTVSIRWQRNEQNFELSWIETGGPTVHPPTRTGFGQTILEKVASGAARTDYRPEGLRWTLTGLIARPG